MRVLTSFTPKGVSYYFTLLEIISNVWLTFES